MVVEGETRRVRWVHDDDDDGDDYDDDVADTEESEAWRVDWLWQVGLGFVWFFLLLCF